MLNVLFPRSFGLLITAGPWAIWYLTTTYSLSRSCSANRRHRSYSVMHETSGTTGCRWKYIPITKSEQSLQLTGLNKISCSPRVKVIWTLLGRLGSHLHSARLIGLIRRAPKIVYMSWTIVTFESIIIIDYRTLASSRVPCMFEIEIKNIYEKVYKTLSVSDDL